MWITNSLNCALEILLLTYNNGNSKTVENSWSDDTISVRRKPATLEMFVCGTCCSLFLAQVPSIFCSNHLCLFVCQWLQCHSQAGDENISEDRNPNPVDFCCPVDSQQDVLRTHNITWLTNQLTNDAMNERTNRAILKRCGEASLSVASTNHLLLLLGASRFDT